MPACQRSLRAKVLPCPRGLRANVPAYQHTIFTCQRSNECATVPNGLPTFQLSVPTYQKTYQFFKHTSYEMQRKVSVLYYYIKYSTLYLMS